MIDSGYMFTNYRRNFFIALAIIIFLLATDTSVEQSARQFFLTTFGLDVGGDMSVVGTLDALRTSVLHQLNDLFNYILLQSTNSTGIIYMFWYVVRFLVSVLQTIASNLYLFYVALAALVYFVLTSRLFKNHYDY